MTKQTLIQLVPTWDLPLVPAGTATDRHLLVEVGATSSVATARQRGLNLALVIDRSGSMAGGRLLAAREAAGRIVDALGAEDRLSLVSFDHGVRTLVACLPMDEIGKATALSALRELTPGATTNLGAGWFAGAGLVADATAAGHTRNGHVLVLSDGRANRGVIDPDVLARHAAEIAARGVLSSALGIGADYSPLQLDAIADAGGGRLHDAETAEDIVDVVLGELGDVRSVVVQDARLRINPPAGIEIEPLTRRSHDTRQCELFAGIDLGDLLAGRTRPVAVLVRVPALPVGTRLDFELALDWLDPQSGRHDEATVRTALDVVPPAEAEQAFPDLVVVHRVADLWEASIGYQAMRLNEARRYREASLLYERSDHGLARLIAPLDDARARRARLRRDRLRVTRYIPGRAKRDELVGAKKAMLNEIDHRRSWPERRPDRRDIWGEQPCYPDRT